MDLAAFVARLWAAGAAEGAAVGPAQLAGRLAGQRVMELGCGHALPGLVALLAGAEVHFQVGGWVVWGMWGQQRRGGPGAGGEAERRLRLPPLIQRALPARRQGPQTKADMARWPRAAAPLVHCMQDYNREVLQAVTIPNVAANWAAWQLRAGAPSAAAETVPAAAAAAATAAGAAGGAAGAAPNGGSSSSAGGEAAAPPARYFCGDWSGLGGVLEAAGLAGGYDVVLSAGTIYSLDSIRSLLQCIQQVSGQAGQAHCLCAGRLCCRPRAHCCCLGEPARPRLPARHSLPNAVPQAAGRCGIHSGQVLLLWRGRRHRGLPAAGGGGRAHAGGRGSGAGRRPVQQAGDHPAGVAQLGARPVSSARVC